MLQTIHRYLDTVGDGSGTKLMTGDFSSGVTQFFIAPAAGVVCHIHRMLIHVEDSAIAADAYGAIAAGALTNGIVIQVRRGDTEVLENITDDLPIKTCAQWSRLMYDTSHKTWGAGNEFMSGRLSFDKSGGPIVLHGDYGDRLTVLLNDNFQHLVDHTILVQGEMGN